MLRSKVYRGITRTSEMDKKTVSTIFLAVTKDKLYSAQISLAMPADTKVFEGFVSSFDDDSSFDVDSSLVVDVLEARKISGLVDCIDLRTKAFWT
jgi:hypothetical protein